MCEGIHRGCGNIQFDYVHVSASSPGARTTSSPRRYSRLGLPVPYLIYASAHRYCVMPTFSSMTHATHEHTTFPEQSPVKKKKTSVVMLIPVDAFHSSAYGEWPAQVHLHPGPQTSLSRHEAPCSCSSLMACHGIHHHYGSCVSG
jgi:hypothetical protein